jgi:hypothetical protein
MADNKQLSPGVKVIEKDFTQVTPRVSVSTGALAGKFAWGPVMDPQLISNETQLATVFGTPDDTTYESWFTAANFLNYSNSLYVNRADSVTLLNAVANPSGGISSIGFANPNSQTGHAGSGYTSVPTVIISAPNKADGVQAEAVAVLAGAGLVTQVSGSINIINSALITNGGTGFSVGDIVIFSDPQETVDTTDQTTGVVTSVLDEAQGRVATVSSGAITSIEVTYAGRGYTAAATITGFTQADGSARATGTFTASSIPVQTSAIKKITMTVIGSGYNAAPSGTLPEGTPALRLSGGGGSGVVLSATVAPSGIKVKNNDDYDDNWAAGQGIYGMVAAKYAGKLGNSLRFSMCDSSTFDRTLDGEFYARTNVETYEDRRELRKLRRVLPGTIGTAPAQPWATPANVPFTVTSESCANKTIRTQTGNTVRVSRTSKPYAHIIGGVVSTTSPVSSATYYKITLAQECAALTAIMNAGVKLQDAAITFQRSGLASTSYGTFDGFVKEWDEKNNVYAISKKSFFVKRTNSTTTAVLTANGADTLSMSLLAGYKIGSTTTTSLLGAVVGVELSDVLNLTTNATAELNKARCDKEWQYGDQFSKAPGTSKFAADVGALNDELHMILIDTTGDITGTKDSVIQKWEGASKALDAKYPDGTSSYYKNVINSSPWLWWLDHPETITSDATRSEWGVAAKYVNFRDIDDGVSSTAIASNPVKGHSLAGGADATSMTAGNIMDAYATFEDTAQYEISLIPTGNVAADTAAWIIENIAAKRQDCVAFVSAPLLIGSGTDIATQMVDYRNTVDVGDVAGSYGVMDSGWKYQYDKYNDMYRWIPLNGDVAGVCAYTDSVTDTWFSPGGFNRGKIKNVTKLAFNPNQAQRDVLYQAGINPVTTFPGDGTILFGDKTMQTKPSAFDRINVRRLFIVLEKTIAKAAKYQLFEYNDEFTRAQFRNIVEPYLRDVQGRRGITDFKVLCDTSNNTAEVIDANEFIADIYIKPARSINYITLNFIATKTGVTFSR